VPETKPEDNVPPSATRRTTSFPSVADIFPRRLRSFPTPASGSAGGADPYTPANTGTREVFVPLKSCRNLVLESHVLMSLFLSFFEGSREGGDPLPIFITQK
jgi:hypothetical protein